MSDKPLVSVVMAVYNPNRKWFQELLDSVMGQTYNNLELVVRDDYSTDITVDEIKRAIDFNDSKIKYRIFQNRENIGSNKTFELLIKEAKGEYIVFCDQDDVWEKDKIERLYNEIINNDAVMSYSDASIIDIHGEIVYNSLRELRKRIEYVEGYNLTSNYLFANCTAGCTMMIRADIAKIAGKIPLDTYWDHWICLIASLEGKIVFVDKQLIRYRQHNNNQSGVMAGINNKDDYYRLRVIAAYKREEELIKRGYMYCGQDDDCKFIVARKKRNILGIIRFRHLCKKEAYFEILIKYLPEWIFRKVVNRIR